MGVERGGKKGLVDESSSKRLMGSQKKRQWEKKYVRLYRFKTTQNQEFNPNKEINSSTDSEVACNKNIF